MKCWVCNTELIWGGDHDIEEECEDYYIVTNLSCPNCQAHVDVYHYKGADYAVQEPERSQETD